MLADSPNITFSASGEDSVLRKRWKLRYSKNRGGDAWNRRRQERECDAKNREGEAGLKAEGSEEPDGGSKRQTISLPYNTFLEPKNLLTMGRNRLKIFQI